MLRTRIITTTGALALALAAPTAARAQEPLRTPDPRDALTAPKTERDPHLASSRGALRTIAPAQASAAPEPDEPAPDGFAWGDAGIAAAGVLGIVLALAGIALLTTHRRRRDHVPAARH